eukprot:SAG22_NODE_265_length_13348_cov_150.719149_13_plen_160_part_00
MLWAGFASGVVHAYEADPDKLIADMEKAFAAAPPEPQPQLTAAAGAAGAAAAAGAAENGSEGPSAPPAYSPPPPVLWVSGGGGDHDKQIAGLAVLPTGAVVAASDRGEATVLSFKGSDHCLSFCFSAFPCGSTALTSDRCNQACCSGTPTAVRWLVCPG